MAEENKNIGAPRAYIIKIKSFSKFILWLQEVATSILIFLNLKNSDRFWGIVYDSVSKQPLDPVIVKLIYTDGKEADSCITDLEGRYGFLARRGKFKIIAKKTNYSFPSGYISGQQDGIYENLYHGEFFVLNKDEEVVAPNIPMDPENFDWNQKAKQQIVVTNPHKKLFVRRLAGFIFWSLFILSIAAFFVPSSLGKIIFYISVPIFSFFIVLAVTLPEPRLWGEISLKIKGIVPDNLYLELNNAQFPDVSHGKAKINQNGKFLLRANNGKYLLSMKYVDLQNKINLLGIVPIKVGNNGVFNCSVVLKDV